MLYKDFFKISCLYGQVFILSRFNKKYIDRHRIKTRKLLPEYNTVFIIRPQSCGIFKNQTSR